jgi:hypothetical protein
MDNGFARLDTVHPDACYVYVVMVLVGQGSTGAVKGAVGPGLETDGLKIFAKEVEETNAAPGQIFSFIEQLAQKGIQRESRIRFA